MLRYLINSIVAHETKITNYSIDVFINSVRFLSFQIESLDDHSGRLLIKLALGSTKDWFNEFMVQPVSKAEYAQYGKVLSKLRKAKLSG